MDHSRTGGFARARERRNHTTLCRNRTRSCGNHSKSSGNRSKSSGNHSKSSGNHSKSCRNHSKSCGNHSKSSGNHSKSRIAQVARSSRSGRRRCNGRQGAGTSAAVGRHVAPLETHRKALTRISHAVIPSVERGTWAGGARCACLPPRPPRSLATLGMTACQAIPSRCEKCRLTMPFLLDPGVSKSQRPPTRGWAGAFFETLRL